MADRELLSPELLEANPNDGARRTTTTTTIQGCSHSLDLLLESRTRTLPTHPTHINILHNPSLRTTTSPPILSVSLFPLSPKTRTSPQIPLILLFLLLPPLPIPFSPLPPLTLFRIIPLPLALANELPSPLPTVLHTPSETLTKNDSDRRSYGVRVLRVLATKSRLSIRVGPISKTSPTLLHRMVKRLC